MRIVLLALLAFLLSTTSFAAKKSESDLRARADLFDRSLETKDTIMLNKLLSPSLRYGHSNGWVESKEELKANLYNGKLTYNAIMPRGGPLQITIEDNTGLIRSEVGINVMMDGKPFEFHLAVLQVWVFQDDEWKLIARQSTKVETN